LMNERGDEAAPIGAINRVERGVDLRGIGAHKIRR
jgi:hypothetical protein